MLPMLEWALNARCPVDLADARIRTAPLMLVACGQLQLLQQLWPIQADFQKTLIKAAEYGQLEMLEWLLSQEPEIHSHLVEGAPEPLVWTEIFMDLVHAAAAHGHLHVLDFLITFHPPAGSGYASGRSFKRIGQPRTVHGHCLLTLAKAGYGLHPTDTLLVPKLMCLKCSIVGLVQWASKIDLQAALASGDVHQQPSQGGNQLLAQMSRLPDELVARIAAQSINFKLKASTAATATNWLLCSEEPSTTSTITFLEQLQAARHAEDITRLRSHDVYQQDSEASYTSYVSDTYALETSECDRYDGDSSDAEYGHWD